MSTVAYVVVALIVASSTLFYPDASRSAGLLGLCLFGVVLILRSQRKIPNFVGPALSATSKPKEFTAGMVCLLVNAYAIFSHSA